MTDRDRQQWIDLLREFNQDRGAQFADAPDEEMLSMMDVVTISSFWLALKQRTLDWNTVRA